MQRLQPLSVGGILDAGINIGRSRWWTVVKAVLVVTIPIQLVAAVVDLSASGSKPIQGADGVVRFEDGRSAAIYFGGQALTIVLILIGTALATAAAFRSLLGAYLGDDPDWRESLRFARSRWRSVLWLSILVALWSLVGAVACGVGLFVAIGWLAVATPVLLVEGRKGGEAVTRSRELVRGRFWPTLGVVLLSALIVTLGQLALTAPLLAVVFSGSGGDLGRAALTFVTSVVTRAAFLPFSAAVTIALYVDLRVRKEGFDLMLLAQRMDVAPPEGGFPAQPGVPPWEQPGGFGPGAPGAWPPPEASPGSWPPGGAPTWGAPAPPPPAGWAPPPAAGTGWGSPAPAPPAAPPAEPTGWPTGPDLPAGADPRTGPVGWPALPDPPTAGEPSTTSDPGPSSAPSPFGDLPPVHHEPPAHEDPEPPVPPPAPPGSAAPSSPPSWPPPAQPPPDRAPDR